MAILLLALFPIVFVFDTAFASAHSYRRDRFQFQEGGVDNHVEMADVFTALRCAYAVT